MERNLPRLAVHHRIRRSRIGVPRLADAARIDEPKRARREAQRGPDVSHDAVWADLDGARSVGVPGAADLELRVEAPQLEEHLVKPRAAAHPADRVSEHRVHTDDAIGGAQLAR